MIGQDDRQASVADIRSGVGRQLLGGEDNPAQSHWPICLRSGASRAGDGGGGCSSAEVFVRFVWFGFVRASYTVLCTVCAARERTAAKLRCVPSTQSWYSSVVYRVKLLYILNVLKKLFY